MGWIEAKPKPSRHATAHLGFRWYMQTWFRHCLDRDLMYDAMLGAMRLRVWYEDGSPAGYWRARRQLYSWARVHAVYFDIPLVAALYATMEVAAYWKSAQVVKCEHGEYITTRWSMYLQNVG